MTRLAVDGPSILWGALKSGTDPEAYKVRDPESGKDVMVATAGYGADVMVDRLVAQLHKFDLAPKDLILVWEGKTPTAVRKRKVTGGGGYKENRAGRPERAFKEFNAAIEIVNRAFLELGAATCVQDDVEADDVLAFMAQHAEERLIIYTRDGDLARLVGENPKGAKVSVTNGDWLDTNPYGPFPNDLITLYKALVGDSSDNIKGAKGLGDTAFLKLLATYGVEGLAQLEGLIVARKISELNEQAEQDKILAKIVNDEAGVYVSYTLAKLYPDAVDTRTRPLKWTYGMVRDLRQGDDERLAEWYGTRTLVHAGNYMAMVKWARSQVGDCVALDLETTTSEESDDWIAQRRKRDEDAGIDVLGSEIVSCGLTFGDNLQHTVYLTHRHAPEPGVEQLTIDQLTGAIAYVTRGKRVVCHNAGGFELPVLRNHTAFEGNDEGFLPNVHCTKLLVNYVNENKSSGLKPSAREYFGYEQQTYQEVTGGLKMDQLTASHVFAYGTDDTIVTAALYNHLSLRCQLEDTWRVYCEVEPVPMYLQALAFLLGTRFSLQRMLELEQEDDAAYERAWAVLRQFLIDGGWGGTVCPSYGLDITAAQIKEAFEIVTGRPLETQVRTPAKLAKLIALEEGGGELAFFLERCLGGDPEPLNQLVKAHFKGEPQINLSSYKQVGSLLYETLGLPVRLRNKPTEDMLAKGVTEGNAATNELAIQMALHYDKGGAHPEVLKSLLALKTIETRRKMFYGPYRHVAHWSDNLVHASFNQCATVTRRYSCSGPNLQQLPKKGEGVKFREVVLPHHEQAVVVSMDFSGQELRLMAEDSQDPVMLACYVGDQLKDLHSITGAGIAHIVSNARLSYDELAQLVDSGNPIGKHVRSMGKKVNFTVQYGAMAKKLGLTLMVEEAEAQAILDARNELFHVSEQWKKDYIERCKNLGYATTRLGARRHLRDAFDSDDYSVAGKAERQGPNFRIQGSGAEMTKLAMKSMWERRLFFRYDAVPYGPVHDEYVASCAVKDLVPFLREMHTCMTQPYGGMQVPIVSSISFGRNFGEQVEIGEIVDENEVRAALQKLGLELKQAA